MTQRPISTEEFTLPKNSLAPRPGLEPQLEWIEIAKLVVDDTYQRPITKEGRRNVMAIALGFRWSRFAPVVVSPIAGYKYAIVDGQHRVTAAALNGIKKVPCQIITATPEEQAEAFGAINGNVTRIHSLALHKAAVAARDPVALRLDTVARRAGVVILRYPKKELDQQPGETMAIGTIARCLRLHGDEIVVLALRCVTETSNHVRGGLISQVIASTSTVLSEIPKTVRREKQAEIIAAFGRINLIREYGKACSTERVPGTSITSVMTTRVRGAFFREGAAILKAA